MEEHMGEHMGEHMLKTPKHLYQQVADHIRDAILNGEYPPGSMLPSQPKLAREFGVTQKTVGTAIAILRREGLLRVVDNVGSFVRKIPPIPRFAKHTKSHHDSALTTQTEIIQLGPVTAPKEVAEILKIDQETPVAIQKRHIFADKTPVQITTSYIPISGNHPQLNHPQKIKTGRKPTRFTEIVKTRTPDPEEAEFFEINFDQQIFSIQHIAWDAKNRPIEASFHVMPTFQWELHYEWPAD